MKKEKKTDKKDGIKVTIVTEENQQNLSKSKWMGAWTMYQVTNYDSIDFENLTEMTSFGLKHQVIIILKSWRFKSRWN